MTDFIIFWLKPFTWRFVIKRESIIKTLKFRKRSNGIRYINVFYFWQCILTIPDISIMTSNLAFIVSSYLHIFWVIIKFNILINLITLYCFQTIFQFPVCNSFFNLVIRITTIYLKLKRNFRLALMRPKTFGNRYCNKTNYKKMCIQQTHPLLQ